jgi:hypothetical protein
LNGWSDTLPTLRMLPATQVSIVSGKVLHDFVRS